MFGYLRLNHHGLSRHDRERYRAHFCASCHGLAASHGHLSSLLTNYDQTFLQIVFSALDSNDDAPPLRLPCTVVPFRRVLVQPVSTRARALLASLNVALVEAKIADDVTDEGGARSRIAAALLARQAGLARARLEEAGFPVDVIRRLGAAQLEAEQAPAPTLESLSAPSAAVLAEIFGFAATLTQRPEQAGAMRSLGEALGRFIYTFDACDDLRDDLRAARFNALVAALGPDPSPAAVRTFLDDALCQVQRHLAILPLGERRTLTDAVLTALRRRLDAALPARTPAAPSGPGRRTAASPALRGLRWHRAPAGICDACDCGVCDCGACDCGACDCRGAAHCCDAGHCCDACDCCHCGSIVCDGQSCCSAGSPPTEVGGVSKIVKLLFLLLVLALVAMILYYALRPSAPPSAPPVIPASAITRPVNPSRFPSTLAPPTQAPPRALPETR